MNHWAGYVSDIKTTFSRASYLSQKDARAFQYDLLQRSTHVQQTVSMNGPLAFVYSSLAPPEEWERLQRVRIDNLRRIREAVEDGVAANALGAASATSFTQYVVH